jgi:hypothetical protein
MKKIVILLIYIFLIIFPTGLLLRLKVLPSAYFVPQDIIVALIFLFSLPFIKNRKKLLSEKFILYQLFFMFVGLLSLIINSLIFHDINFFVSLLYLIRYFLYISLFGVGIFFVNSKFIGRAVYLSGFVLLVIGFIQFFFYNNLRNLFYLGWDEHLYRLFSTFLDPNYIGVFFVLFFFTLLIRIIKFEFRFVYIEIIVAFFTLIAIYLTYSRTALVVLFVGFLTLAIIKKKYKEMLSVFFVLVFFLLLFSDTSIEGLNPFRTRSSNERIISSIEVSKIIQNNPLIGVGLNAFRYAQIRYGTRTITGASISNADAGTDNSFLFALATTGVIGFIFYFMSYFYLLKMLFKEKSIESLILAISIIGLIAGSFFLNILFYTPILSWVMLVISLRRKIFTKDYR